MITDRAPEVSIVMPAYNAGMYIADAIRSVKQQTCEDWELIVVDDFSSDDTLDIAQSFAGSDSRIHVFKSECNAGSPFQVRERGVRLSRGRLIAPLDADDVIAPDYLQELVARKRHCRCPIVLPTMYRMTGSCISLMVPRDDFDISQVYCGRDLVKNTLAGWDIGAAGGLYDRDILIGCIDSVGNRSLMNADEYLTRLILLRSDRVAISKAKYYYRCNPDSVTRKVSAKYFDRLEINKMLRKLIDDSFGSESEESRRAGLQDFCGIIDCIRYLSENKGSLDSSEQGRARRLIREAYHGIDWRAARSRGGLRYYFLLRMGLPAAAFVLKRYGRRRK